MKETPPPSPTIPPLTQSAAEKHADTILRHFYMGNEVAAPEKLKLPPGYHPTLTGLTNDPGLATLHRGLESVSGTPAVIAQHNAKAINAATATLTGDEGAVPAMIASRNAITGPMREAAFADKTPVTPEAKQPFEDMLKTILSGPDSKRAGVVKYVREIAESAKGETDPEMLYGTLKYLNDLLHPVAQNTDADKQAAAASLMKLKPLLQSAIESGASGFKEYNAKHADLSKPIDALQFLQSLNLTNATGDVRLQAIDSAIKNIKRQQQLPGVQKATWVSKNQLGQLEALRNALRMEAARGAGKPINSTTFQNLATNSRVGQVAGNPLMSGILGQMGGYAVMPGPGGIFLGEVARHLTQGQLARSEAMVRDALLERVLNVGGKGANSLAGPRAAGPRAPGAPWNPLSGAPPGTP